MNRGRRREKIFLDSSDYQAVVDLLVNVSDMFKAQVSAFSLMPDHYHLLVCTPEGNINSIMRHVGGVYTQGFNRRHGHDGQLFRGRHKAILVDEEEYLPSCGAKLSQKEMKRSPPRSLRAVMSSPCGVD